MLALLKHPLLRLGAAAGEHNTAIATLERALLRGPRPRPGSDGLAHALETFRANRDQLHRSDPRWLIADDEFDVAAELIARLGAALAPLETLKPRDQPLAGLAACHRQAIAALSQDAEGSIAAFTGSDGVALARALEELALSPAAASLAVSRGDYPELFHATIAGRVVRRPEIPDVRVRIFGPLEARLQNIDRVVLGGLNEGTWPPETRSDPWLVAPDAPRSRPRPAGAPHRPVGARLRAGVGRQGSHSLARRQAGRRADRDLAVRAAHRRAGRHALERRARARRQLSRARPRARSSGGSQSRRPPGADTAAGGAAVAAVGHRDRGLAARSLYDLRALCAAAAGARPGRHPARRARPRHRHPWRHRRLHQQIRRRPAE